MEQYDWKILWNFERNVSNNELNVITETAVVQFACRIWTKIKIVWNR